MVSIISEIKAKKELSDIPDDIVKLTLSDYLTKHKIIIPENQKAKKFIIKSIRAELRRYAGQYSLSSKSKKDKLIKSKDFKELLKHHSSTKERINDYPLLIDIIQKLKPKSILDLGCGINPLAIAQKGIFYHAYDIKNEDLEIVSAFFKENSLSGDVHHADIRNISKFPDTDLCLILKVLDILGNNKIELSKKFLTEIQAKTFIISFATKTLSGIPMNRPYRRWFEKILIELNLKYKVVRTSQELFYIISKEKIIKII